MNKSQEKALERLRKEFENKVQNENRFEKKLKVEIKKFEVRESDQEFIDLIGYNMVQVGVSIGYVGDENNTLLLLRDYWIITIGKNGGFKTTKRNKKGKSLQTKIHGLKNCVFQGSYRI